MMPKRRSFVCDTRGVTTAECALLIVTILLIAFAGYRLLGKSINGSTECAANMGDCKGNGTVVAGHSLGGGPGDIGLTGHSLGGGPDGTEVAGHSLGGGAGDVDAAQVVKDLMHHLFGGWRANSTFADQIQGNKPKPIDMELADLSNHAYDDRTRKVYPNGPFNPPKEEHTRICSGQWCEVPPDQLPPGMTQEMLDHDNAVLFVDGDGNHVLAYRGSASLSDFGSDIRQARGHDDGQYTEAVTLAQLAKAAYGDNLVLTGHSKGGGEASLAAAVTGLNAVTFNPAGVSNEMLDRYHLDRDAARQQANDNQRAYYVHGDPLTGAQENSPLAGHVPPTMGNRIELSGPPANVVKKGIAAGIVGALYPPAAFVTMPATVAAVGKVDAHSMDTVENSMAKDQPWNR